MRKAALVLSILILVWPLAGCWDRKEISELALVMAKGIDLTDNNLVRVSVQIAIPSKVGGAQTGSSKGEGGKSYFVVSAAGRTVSEADAHVQEKLPRQLYLPHLRIILVGDRMARSGMEKILDHFSRNPPNRLRSTILVAKGSEALPFLKTTYPLESLSGEAIRKLELQVTGTNTTLMDFLIQASSDGMDQMTSAISLQSQAGQEGSQSQPEESQYYQFTNTAIFRDLRLVGYVEGPQTIALQWLNERLRYGTLTIDVPNTKGTISVELTQARRRARTFVRGNDVSVQYSLSGSALLTENTTGLDADDPQTISMFQSALNQYVEQTTEECLNNLNKRLDADTAGIGQMVYHQHPYDWERLKPHWHELLPSVGYNVQSEVKIIEAGKSGPPLYGKTHRGILNRGETSNQVGDSSQ